MALRKLNVLWRTIQGRRRFYQIGRTFPPPTGKDKSILALVPRKEEVGTLVRMLRSFSARQIDLLSIHSRPLRFSLGRYCFIVAVASHVGTSELQEGVLELLKSDVTFKFLGSFQAWQGRPLIAPFEALRGSVDHVGGVKMLLAAMRPLESGL